jgi:FkbM family methyltransferase
MPDGGRETIEESLRHLSLCRARIGSLPAQPRTLRGSAGMLLVRAVRRLLFWFIPQVDAFCAASIETAERQSSLLANTVAAGPDDFFRWRLIGRVGAQPHSQEIDALRAEVAQLSRELAALRAQRQPAIVSGGIVATEVEGFILGIPAEEWRLAAYYTFRGLLEPGLIRYLETVLKPGAVFVDIGANIGIVTLFAARLAGQSGKVYSFEPAPRTFAILKENIQVNGLLESGRIDFRELALADKSGEAAFYVYPANSGHNTMFAGAASAEKIRVRTAALDEVLPPGSRVDAIKIDAEGAEPLIWRGMRRVLADNPGITVVLEFDPGHLSRAGADPGGFLDEIAAAGFSISRIEEPTGELRAFSRDALLAGLTVNLAASRNGAV